MFLHGSSHGRRSQGCGQQHREHAHGNSPCHTGGRTRDAHRSSCKARHLRRQRQSPGSLTRRAWLAALCRACAVVTHPETSGTAGRGRVRVVTADPITRVPTVVNELRASVVSVLGAHETTVGPRNGRNSLGDLGLRRLAQSLTAVAGGRTRLAATREGSVTPSLALDIREVLEMAWDHCRVFARLKRLGDEGLALDRVKVAHLPAANVSQS
jgi:hypothetical protein